MTQHQSGLVLSEVSGLTENILSVMIHRLCVSNEKNDYMWIVAHFTGLLMSMHICLHVCGSVCVEDTLQGSMQCSQLEEEGLMSQSHSVREAIKCSEESTGHSACLVLLFYAFPKLPLKLWPYLPSLSLFWTASMLHPVFHTPDRLVLTRILAMAVNTVPFSNPFGHSGCPGEHYQSYKEE